MKLIAAAMSLICERKSSVLEHFSAMPSKSLRIQAAIRDLNGINGIPSEYAAGRQANMKIKYTHHVAMSL